MMQPAMPILAAPVQPVVVATDMFKYVRGPLGFISEDLVLFAPRALL